MVANVPSGLSLTPPHVEKKLWIRGKEAVLAYEKYYPGIFPGGLRRIMKPLDQESRCPGRDSNQEPLQYKTEEMNGTYYIDGGEMRHNQNFNRNT
jgi:hypothetical protein